jgi:hypothetical protein
MLWDTQDVANYGRPSAASSQSMSEHFKISTEDIMTTLKVVPQTKKEDAKKPSTFNQPNDTFNTSLYAQQRRQGIR